MSEPDPVERLLRLFDFETVGVDRVRVENPDRGFGDRVFGGQVAAQALRAATDTVETDHRPHSLHAYFIRPGRPGLPIDYAVERTRDGRSFTTRRVLASQADEVIFEMSCSFHTEEPGVDYQQPIAPDAPTPDDAPTGMGFIPESERDRIPFDFREIARSEPDESGFYRSTRRVWTRIKRRLPDDPVLHECLITFLSDMGAVMGAMSPNPAHTITNVMGASLDHALWFHRPMRADEWFLYDLSAVSNFGARGLCRGTMHRADGVLGVSMAQEALLRLIDPEAVHA